MSKVEQTALTYEHRRTNYFTIAAHASVNVYAFPFVFVTLAAWQ